MKRFVIILILCCVSSIFPKENDKEISHTLSGVIVSSNTLIFFDTSEDVYKRMIGGRVHPFTGMKISVTPILYWEIGGKFNYIFLKRINKKYALGFDLAIGDIVSVGGWNATIFFDIFTFGFYASYYFFNRITQKISFVYLIDNYWVNLIDEEKNFTLLLEAGISFSFVSFVYFSRIPLYYNTFFIGSYIFVGWWGYSLEKRISNILGFFLEFNFDIGKYNVQYFGTEGKDYIGIEKPPPDTDMKYVLFYLSFGMEYRIGKTF